MYLAWKSAHRSLGSECIGGRPKIGGLIFWLIPCFVGSAGFRLFLKGWGVVPFACLPPTLYVGAMCFVWENPESVIGRKVSDLFSPTKRDARKGGPWPG